ncbi:MAG: ParB/RepB/Spo0J family partition protein [Bacteroidota bacterium]
MSKGSKKEVNKGIRALLGTIESKPTNSTSRKTSQAITISEVEVEKIIPNPVQPRTDFDSDSLDELATSIRTHGIIQPITVRDMGDDTYQIISGERRWRASKLAGLASIPVFIRKADDQTLLEMALLENIQREDLNPVEVAISYQRLIDECALTHEQLSDRLGKKRSSISNHLRVLKLSPAVQRSLRQHEISMGHAKVLAGVKEIESQTMILGEILAKDLSVRATEQITKSSSQTSAPISVSTQPSNPEVLRLQDKLSDVFGQQVSIKRSAQGKGSIHIPFGSDDELNDLIDQLTS